MNYFNLYRQNVLIENIILMKKYKLYENRIPNNSFGLPVFVAGM